MDGPSNLHVLKKYPVLVSEVHRTCIYIILNDLDIQFVRNVDTLKENQENNNLRIYEGLGGIAKSLVLTELRKFYARLTSTLLFFEYM